MKGKILITDHLPTTKQMFKASALGIEAVITTDYNIDLFEKLKTEMAGKAQIGLLILPNKVDLSKLNDLELELDGDKKLLIVNKKL